MAERDSRTTELIADELRKRKAAAGEGPRGHAAPDSGKSRKRRRRLLVLVIVVALVALIVCAIAGLFAWNRWYRFDDAADFQGRWYPVGSTSAIVIDEATIAFDAETAYAYELDTRDKTVTYSLGNLTGKGHYWFSEDRSTLVVVEGGDETPTGIVIDDLKRLIAQVNASIDGRAMPLPEGDGVTALTRMPDTAAVLAKAEAEAAAKAAAQAAEEAEARAAAEAEAEAEAAAAADEDVAAKDEPAADAEAEAGGVTAAGAEASADEAGGGQEEGEAAAEEEPRDFANESMGIFE